MSANLITVYHGTPVDNLDDILHNGLLKKSCQWKHKRVFVTTSLEMAQWYGTLQYGLLHPESVKSKNLVTSCRATVVVFAANIAVGELHLDLNLENVYQRGDSQDRRKHFYLLRNISSSEFLGYTRNVYTIRHDRLWD